MGGLNKKWGDGGSTKNPKNKRGSIIWNWTIFNIDKTTYSNRSLEQRMTVAKISPHCILNDTHRDNCV